MKQFHKSLIVGLFATCSMASAAQASTYFNAEVYYSGITSEVSQGLANVCNTNVLPSFEVSTQKYSDASSYRNPQTRYVYWYMTQTTTYRVKAIVGSQSTYVGSVTASYKSPGQTVSRVATQEARQYFGEKFRELKASLDSQCKQLSNAAAAQAQLAPQIQPVSAQELLTTASPPVPSKPLTLAERKQIASEAVYNYENRGGVFSSSMNCFPAGVENKFEVFVQSYSTFDVYIRVKMTTLEGVRIYSKPLGRNELNPSNGQSYNQKLTIQRDTIVNNLKRCSNASVELLATAPRF